MEEVLREREQERELELEREREQELELEREREREQEREQEREREQVIQFGIAEEERNADGERGGGRGFKSRSGGSPPDSSVRQSTPVIF